MNVQYNQIQEHAFYYFELDHDIAETTENICCAKFKAQLITVQ